MRTRLISSLSHLAGWILFFSLILAFLAGPEPVPFSFFNLVLSWPFLIFAIVYLSLFYLNYFILVPQLYLRRKYVYYFGIIVLLFALVYWLQPFDRMISMKRMNEGPARTEMIREVTGFPNPPGPDPKVPMNGGGPAGRDIISMILFITIVSISSFIPLIRQWKQTERRAMQAETEKAQAELSFLKAQINPHFLFNTLNNIYSMAVVKHENTAPSVMKLSNILRYITDEIGQDFVPLGNEVECMEDYIGLQQMRIGANMNVQVAVSGDVMNKKIPPLLFMTFVENVFKYGISSHEPGTISINLEAGNQEILFMTINKLFPQKENQERNGIGIANARERLQHLYPGKHLLKISRDNGLFIVDLRLDC